MKSIMEGDHMNLKRTRTMIAGLVTAGLLLALTGCSERNPMSPSADPSSRTAGTGSFFAARSSVEQNGHVASVDAGARTMALVGNATPISVAANATVVRRQHGTETPITLAEINVGDSAEVRGSMSGGTLVADRVRIQVEDTPGAEVELNGVVSAIDANARTLSLAGDATSYVVSPTARITQKMSGVTTTIELALIMVGDSVEVKGSTQADGSVLLSSIKLEMEGLEDMRTDVEFKATISAIDYANGTFAVDGHTESIRTDSNTAIFMKQNIDSSGQSAAKPVSDDDGEGFKDEDLRKPIAFSDLKVGDIVEVHANRIDGATLYAVAVELEDGAFEDGLEVEFTAVLASVDLGTASVTFVGRPETGQIAAGADLRGLNNESVALASFAAGQNVEVKGFALSNGNIQVVRMYRDNH
jgi:hypothetical protein